jgi:hypothetical protein
MTAKLTRLDSQNSDTPAPSGRELYHLQFSLQAASPETYGYTLVDGKIVLKWILEK